MEGRCSNNGTVDIRHHISKSFQSYMLFLIYSQKDDAVCLLATSKTGGKKWSARNDLQSAKEKRQLITATSLCLVFMVSVTVTKWCWTRQKCINSIPCWFYFQIAEIVGGYIAGSLAIMADAAHLLSDCISFIVALVAICLSKKAPDNYMTFGYKRVGKYIPWTRSVA